MSSLRSGPKIVDVRLEAGKSDTTAAASVRSTIFEGLGKPVGSKTLPTLLLYDEHGLRLYDVITTDAEEYYLFPLEEEILRTNGPEIVRIMHGERGAVEGEVVLELGAGALRKTSHLLSSLAALVKDEKQNKQGPSPITYYALDLERRELVRTLNQITMKSCDNPSDAACEDYGALGNQLAGKVDARGMWGTYDGGIHFINQGGLDKLRTADEAESVANEVRDKLERASASSTESSSYQFNSDSGSRYTQTTPPSPPLSGLDNKVDPSQTDAPPLHILFLGSSLGNFSREDMCSFLRSLPLRPGSGDTLLLGLDGDNGKELVERAYDDSKGITREFIMNGLKGAGRALGDESLFSEGKWKYVSIYNEAERRHEAYYKSVGSQTLEVPGRDGESGTFLSFADGEMINVEHSHKYSHTDVSALFSGSNLRVIQKWTDERELYSLYLLERPPFHFPLIDEPKAAVSSPNAVDKAVGPFNVPAVSEWLEMWKAWDLITLGMIPQSMLHEKPIDLRHKCLFYLGHIPAFLDIHLSKLLNEPNIDPQEYKHIFERGIDPHVDDPTQCNPHSEVPEDDSDWPNLAEIVDYRDRVRQRVIKLYDDIKSGHLTMNRKIARVLFMTFEHEGLHAETLLYMLIQRAGTGTLPPPKFRVPDFDALSRNWDAEYATFASSPLRSVVKLGPQVVTLGHDDFEADDLTVPLDPTHEFGWDNEHPKREVNVGEFSISWRPVTNGEFYAHWSDEDANIGGNKVGMPASWVKVRGGLCVRTLYGPIGFEHAQHWPVLTSYDDLSTYARVKGGRLPTMSELRAFCEKFQSGFVGGGNVGFRNWHPVPATTGRERGGGKGHNGGVWEWTSTKLDNYQGYIPSGLYPGYSMDFFDDKHHVVIGGSYATTPRIAQRSSFCNWYQHNYPYAWVGGRIVYDL